MTSHLRTFAASSTGVTCTAKSFSAATSRPAAAGSHSRWWMPGSSSQKSPFAPARSRSTVPATPFVVNVAVTATSHFVPPASVKSMSTFVFHGHRCVQLVLAVIAPSAQHAQANVPIASIFFIVRLLPIPRSPTCRRMTAAAGDGSRTDSSTQSWNFALGLKASCRRTQSTNWRWFQGC